MSLSADMSRLANELRASYDSRTNAVDTLRAATTRQVAELHKQHQAMAATQRQQLQQSAEVRRQAVSTLMHDLQVKRATMSADQRRRLDAYTCNLNQRTQDSLARVHAVRQAIHNDHAEAQRAWRQFNDEMRRKRVAHG